MPTHDVKPRRNPVTSLLDQLTRPHSSITDIEMRRQSRLLAALTLTLVVTVGSHVANVFLNLPAEVLSTVKFTIPGLVLTLAFYFLNRSGRYRLSALLFVALNFVLIYFSAVATRDLSWLLFANMVMIIGAILMPANITTLLFVGSIGLQILIAMLAPMTTTITNLAPLMIFIITSSLLLVFIRHRSGLERERQEELQQANRQLRDSEAQLERRVEERTRELVIAKEQAEVALQRAEKADQIKSQFLASMSHELRTPLNAILTFNELMAMGTFGDVNEEQIDYLKKSLESGRHLLSLINDVLDITKIQSGMMKLFTESGFDIAKEIEAIAVSAEKMLTGKPVQLIRDIDDKIPPFVCDKRRVRQVLLNLVSNAVKFTEQGTITVSAKKRDNELLVAVIDTGPGIPTEQQEVIFEPFVQTETGIKHAGGTGLGLPISKSLVTAHGGQFWVESTPGEGAAFYVVLPLRVEAELVEEMAK
jgi:signal transduction histidine kinase